jgi:hypothetical protein
VSLQALPGLPSRVPQRVMQRLCWRFVDH